MPIWTNSPCIPEQRVSILHSGQQSDSFLTKLFHHSCRRQAEDCNCDFVWQIDNKYYSSLVHIQSQQLDKAQLQETPAGVVVLSPCSAAEVRELLSGHEPDVAIMISEDSESSEEWQEMGFEHVNISQKSDKAGKEGYERIREALESRIWAQCTMKGDVSLEQPTLAFEDNFAPFVCAENSNSEAKDKNSSHDSDSESQSDVEDMPSSKEIDAIFNHIFSEADGDLDGPITRLRALQSQAARMEGDVEGRRKVAERVALAFATGIEGDEGYVQLEDETGDHD